MIILQTKEKITEILNIGKSVWTFQAKISFNNPNLSEWITLKDNTFTFPNSRINDFETMCIEQYITIEWRT